MATHRQRRVTRAAAVVALTAILTGCSQLPLAMPGAAPADRVRQPVRVSPDGFMPDWIEGLTIVHDASEDADCPWSTSYPAVPGAAPLTGALRDSVREYLAGVREGGDGGTCLEPAGTPGLQVTFDFLIASGDVVGVRLTYRDAAAEDEATRTFWYDGRTRTVVRPWALIAPAARGEAVAAIRDALAERPGADPDVAQAALARDSRAETLRDLSFDSRGGLHLRFRPGVVAPEHAGRQEVVIPRATAAGWLSPVGLRAQEQAVHTEHRLRLGGAPASGAPAEPAQPVTPVTPPAQETDDVDCHAVKCIALTFDDGPGPYTAELLDDLARHSAHATFFVLGQHVAADPDIVRAEVAAGHEVGNHSWSHPQLTKLTSTAVARQLSRTDDAIDQATGGTPTLFRPPYGLVNDAVRREGGRPVVLWDRDTEDWKVRDADKVATNVVETARPGDIVLMHDIHPTTVQAVPRILDELAARGFHFVTVSDLLAGTTLEPGRSYFSNPGIANPS